MRFRPVNRSRLAIASQATRSQMKPTVRHVTRISSATAFLEVLTVSQHAWSSNATVNRESCRAHGTAATTTRWSLQYTRGASASRYANVVPRSSARQRRRPSPQSSRGQRRSHTPQRCFSRDFGRTDTTIAPSSTPDVLDHRPLDPEQHLPYAWLAHAATALSHGSKPSISRNPKSTAACALLCPLLGRPAPDLTANQRGRTAPSSSANPQQSTATTRAPQPTIEALLDRRRATALPALSPQPTPANSTSAGKPCPQPCPQLRNSEVI